MSIPDIIGNIITLKLLRKIGTNILLGNTIPFPLYNNTSHYQCEIPERQTKYRRIPKLATKNAFAATNTTLVRHWKWPSSSTIVNKFCSRFFVGFSCLRFFISCNIRKESYPNNLMPLGYCCVRTIHIELKVTIYSVNFDLETFSNI